MKDIIVDLRKKQQLNESWLGSFGNIITNILERMFNGYKTKLKIHGNKREIKSFLKAIKSEYKYLKSLRKYGLTNPDSIRNRTQLKASIKKFETETGLIWPFK